MELKERTHGSITAIVTARQEIEFKVNGDPVFEFEVPEGEEWKLVVNVQIEKFSV